MTSETSLVASNVRLNEWALQVRECQNRPHSMKVEEWCEQHGLTKAGYYYRMRRVREAMLGVLDLDQIPELVEINPNRTQEVSPLQTDAAAAIQIGSGKVIQLNESASEDFLRKLLKAIQSC